MRRRGPDGAGLWCNGRALMGARRLAIMDLSSSAAMPMCSLDGRYVLAFNGELYDHHDYRGDLSARGWRFTTRSDTETVLAALAMHGPDVLDDFNGMFALSFYDAREHSLLLARDHAGIKPLYAADAGTVAFCSEFDTLLASPANIPRIADPTALVQYLDFGHIFAPRTLAKNVELLEPGERRHYTRDGRRQSRFDRLRNEHASYLKDQDAEEALCASLQAAVLRQSRSDAPAGYLLSGGLDSRLLAHIGSELHPGEPIRTFAAGIEGPLADERAEAADEARYLHADHQQIGVSASASPDLFEDAIAAIHEPIGDEGILPTLLVSELARRTVRVVFSGEGADELLFGYVYRHGAANCFATDASREYSKLYQEFTESRFDSCFPGAKSLRDGALPAVSWTGAGAGAMEWMRRAELHTYLPFVLLKTDRASMFHSLEARVPYLDKEVIRTALQIRPPALFDPSTNRGKLLSRALLARRGRPVSRPKRGFTAPVEEWLRGPLRPQLEVTVGRLAGLAALPVESPAIRKLAEDHWESRIDAGMALWRLLILDHWAARAGF